MSNLPPSSSDPAAASAVAVAAAAASLAGTKVLFFDLMGTCLDWHSAIARVLASASASASASTSTTRTPFPSPGKAAMLWRGGYFTRIRATYEGNGVAEKIDVIHRKVLDRLLEERGLQWAEEEREQAVRAWHDLKAWPDVEVALPRLQEKFGVFVLANGTTRFQLDLMRSSGLRFDMPFSSELLGLIKPDIRIYQKAASLVDVKPEDCIMVAAHAYDLLAAKATGMKTVYILRTTEDRDQDMDVIREENDVFIDGTDGTEYCGLSVLADLLGA